MFNSLILVIDIDRDLEVVARTILEAMWEPLYAKLPKLVFIEVSQYTLSNVSFLMIASSVMLN